MSPHLSSRFLTSSASVSGCPESPFPEFAFIGRSNVGKSSLINMLAGRKGLAKTSSNPGKTRLINHFVMDERWCLVDLPGYGYARISKDERARLRKMIEGYILKRENLACTFLLVDSRIEPQKQDLEFMEWLASHEKLFVMLFTKTDKRSSSRINANLKVFSQALMKSWESLPLLILTSAETGKGRREVLEIIEDLTRIRGG